MSFTVRRYRRLKASTSPVLQDARKTLRQTWRTAFLYEHTHTHPSTSTLDRIAMRRVVQQPRFLYSKQDKHSPVDTLDTLGIETMPRLIDALTTASQSVHGVMHSGERVFSGDDDLDWGTAIPFHDGDYELQMRVYPKQAFTCLQHVATHECPFARTSGVGVSAFSMSGVSMRAHSMQCVICDSMANKFGTKFASSPCNSVAFASNCTICIRVRSTHFRSTAPSLVTVTELVPQSIYSVETLSMFRGGSNSFDGESPRAPSVAPYMKMCTTNSHMPMTLQHVHLVHTQTAEVGRVNIDKMCPEEMAGTSDPPRTSRRSARHATSSRCIDDCFRLEHHMDEDEESTLIHPGYQMTSMSPLRVRPRLAVNEKQSNLAFTEFSFPEYIFSIASILISGECIRTIRSQTRVDFLRNVASGSLPTDMDDKPNHLCVEAMNRLVQAAALPIAPTSVDVGRKLANATTKAAPKTLDQPSASKQKSSKKKRAASPPTPQAPPSGQPPAFTTPEPTPSPLATSLANSALAASWDIAQMMDLMSYVARLTGVATRDALPDYMTCPFKYPLVACMALRMASRSHLFEELKESTMGAQPSAESSKRTSIPTMALEIAAQEFNRCVEGKFPMVTESLENSASDTPLLIDFFVRSAMCRASKQTAGTSPVVGIFANGSTLNLHVKTRCDSWKQTGVAFLQQVFSPKGFHIADPMERIRKSLNGQEGEDEFKDSSSARMCNTRTWLHRHNGMLPSFDAPEREYNPDTNRFLNVSNRQIRDRVVKLVVDTENALRELLISRESAIYVHTYKRLVVGQPKTMKDALFNLDESSSSESDDGDAQGPKRAAESSATQPTSTTANDSSLLKHASRVRNMLSIHLYGFFHRNVFDYETPGLNPVRDIEKMLTTAVSGRHFPSTEMLCVPVFMHAPTVRVGCASCGFYFPSLLQCIPMPHSRCNECRKFLCPSCLVARSSDETKPFQCFKCHGVLQQHSATQKTEH